MNPNHPELRSFIEVSKTNHFPIQNLPYGVFQKAGQEPRVGVAIGDFILDLTLLEKEKILSTPKPIFQDQCLNTFMAMKKNDWVQVREHLSRLLRHDNPLIRDQAALRSRCLVHQDQVSMQLPAHIGDYTDFYSSRQHAVNIGMMLRDKNNPLLPNWLQIPIGYHGRASSIVASSTPIRRPKGQILQGQSETPILSETQKLDFELEVACFIGSSNELSHPIPIDRASDYIFGLVLLNDWSSRDVQRWEYQPLGPFLSKSFATSISPWIVTSLALEPFKTERTPQDPVPLPYLREAQTNSLYSIDLEVSLKTSKLEQPEVISHSNMKNLYWSLPQQIAHHTISGCNLRAGDLLASGTISGEDPTAFGSMMELSWNGSKPIKFSNDEERSFLQDGDEVIMKAWADTTSYRVGFGEVRGKILPAFRD